MNGEGLRAAKDGSAAWAAEVLADPGTLILDTETTGLQRKDQVIQLAAVNREGLILLNTNLCPSVEIEEAARHVHGLSMSDVQDAPTMLMLYPRLFALFQEASRVVIYNRAFDWRLLEQTLGAFGCPLLAQRFPLLRVECAMVMYAQWFGEWNVGRKSFTWQRLPRGGHDALSDCLATLAVLREMAGGPRSEVRGPRSGVRGSRFGVQGVSRETLGTLEAWKEIDDGA